MAPGFEYKKQSDIVLKRLLMIKKNYTDGGYIKIVNLALMILLSHCD